MNITKTIEADGIVVCPCSDFQSGGYVRVYYLLPTSWAINGMLTSRREDIDEEILAFSESSYLPS